MRASTPKRGFLVVLFALLTGLNAQAQYPSDAERYLLEPGSPAFNTPIGVPNGFVNLANGNLHIEIPIVGYPQRGGVPYVAKWVYDSRIWQITSTQNGYIWSPTNISGSLAGWRLKISNGRSMSSSDVVSKSCVQSGTTYYWIEASNYRYSDMGGTNRRFPIFYDAGAPCHTAANLTNAGPALDGSGMWMNATLGQLASSVIAADGTKLYDVAATCVNERMKDTNGNYVEQEVDGYCDYATFTDSLNRTLPSSIVNNSGSTYYYFPVSSSGGTGLYSFVYGTKTGVGSQFSDENVTNAWNIGLNVLSSIVLPDTTSYSFTYDSQGTLASMTLPTGATISFTYTNAFDAQNNTNRYLNTIVVDSQTTTYTPGTCGTNCNKMVVAQPNGDESEYRFNINRGAWLTQTKAFTGSVTSGTLLQTTTIDYENNSTNSVLGSTAFTRPIRTTTILPIPGDSLIKKSELTWETFSYDYRGTNYTGTRGNVTTSKEFRFIPCNSNCAGVSWASSDELRRTVTTYLHAGNSNYATTTSSTRNIVNRATNVQLQTYSGTKLTETITNYDDYSSPNQLTSVSSVTHHDTSNFGTSFVYRGNPTSVQVWTGGSNYLTTTVKYDITGQVVKVTNPRSKETTYSYTDSYFVDDSTSSPGAYSPTPPTTNAYVTSSTSPLSGTVTRGYYYRTGAIAKATDVNGNTSVTSYYGDGMGRPTKTILPTGVSTTASYPSAIQVSITTPTATAQANFDTRGRLKDTKLTNDPQGTVTTETTYDPLGRVLTKTNPYRSTSEATYGVTTYEYDGLSRVKKVTLPDNMTQWSYYGAEMSTGGGRTSQLCSTTTYGYGYPTLAKDEAGKKRQSWTDAFGRLIEADEPDSSGSLTLGTCYKYDERGNLKEVNQGVQTRTNTYENSSGTTIGLGRLITEVTPEGGTVNLYYTTSGGALCAANPSAVCRSTDARNITTTFTYDDEDRLVSKSYSNSDPTVTYYYDYNCLNSSGSFVNDATCSGGLQLTNGKGRRVGMDDGSGQSAWKYNTLGQATTLRRKIGSISKDITYGYTTDGRFQNMIYPSGNGVYYYYRTDGKLQKIQRTSSGTTTAYPIYADSINYAPQGALSTYTFGYVNGGFAGIAMASTYNNRLQPVNMTAKHTSNTVTLLDYTYSFIASSINDGHVKSVTNNVDNNRTQSYTYDEMNRLASAQTQGSTGSSCWGLSYEYDRYANLKTANVTKCSANGLSLSIDAYTNRLVADCNNGSAVCYDAAGNMLRDGVGGTFTWNAEGRMAATAGINYTYNGDGQRVKKAASSSSQYDKLYWYGLGGEVLAESDLSGILTSEYIFMGSTRIARRDVSSGNVYYYLGDRLGSARLVADASGTKVEESDFLPFGTERTIYNDSSVTDNTYKFTGHERDGESGLDHTLYRQYSSTLGRWFSMDPFRGGPKNPQSLNRYAYVGNDPINSADPLGMCSPNDDPPCYSATGTGTAGPLPPSGPGLWVDPIFPGGNGPEAGLFGDWDTGEQESVSQSLPTPQTRLAAAAKLAAEMLKKKNCASLFKGDGDPGTMLEGLLRGDSEYGEFAYGFLPADTNAQTEQIPIINENGIPVPGPTSRITINTNSQSAFNRGSPQSNAVTIIHELGHAYANKYGVGATAIQRDGNDDDASETNRKLVEDNCL